MFFCTIEKTLLDKYWVNYSVWFECNPKNKPVDCYLSCLFDYFSSVEVDDKENKVIFDFGSFSFNYEDLVKSENKFVDVDVKMGSIGSSLDHIEIDFANKGLI